MKENLPCLWRMELDHISTLKVPSMKANGNLTVNMEMELKSGPPPTAPSRASLLMASETAKANGYNTTRGTQVIGRTIKWMGLELWSGDSKVNLELNGQKT